MGTTLSQEQIDRVVAFHGHMCPGVSMGIRVAEAALRALGQRAVDEDLVAVVETDNCAVDAVQYLTGCTFGKGNLIHLDHGQNVFTFARRSDGKAVRIEGVPFRPRQMTADEEAVEARVRAGSASAEDAALHDKLWRERIDAILSADEEALLRVELLADYAIPNRAQIHPSIACADCDQLTMSTRLHDLDGRMLCATCFDRALRDRVAVTAIGVVHNELGPGVSRPRARAPESTIEVYPRYADGLVGIDRAEELQVLFAFERPLGDGSLLQHRRGDRSQPATGVFTLRSPLRPSPIGSTVVKLLRVDGTRLIVGGLDCWDGTRVIDIKPAVRGDGRPC